ncbi:MAG: YmdB family metallophosphoesterase, partial [Pseudomonadota bacterium]
MRILFLGDMVGKTGRTAVFDNLPEIKKRLRPDCTIVNGENAASGFG